MVSLQLCKTFAVLSVSDLAAALPSQVWPQAALSCLGRHFDLVLYLQGPLSQGLCQNFILSQLRKISLYGTVISFICLFISEHLNCWYFQHIIHF